MPDTHVRNHRMVGLKLSEVALAKLDTLAILWLETRSASLARLIRAAPRRALPRGPDPLDTPAAYTLPPDAIDRLSEIAIAWDTNKSAAVDNLIRAAPERRIDDSLVAAMEAAAERGDEEK